MTKLHNIDKDKLKSVLYSAVKELLEKKAKKPKEKSYYEQFTSYVGVDGSSTTTKKSENSDGDWATDSVEQIKDKSNKDEDEDKEL